jgi:hypothetical protein
MSSKMPRMFFCETKILLNPQRTAAMQAALFEEETICEKKEIRFLGFFELAPEQI